VRRACTTVKATRAQRLAFVGCRSGETSTGAFVAGSCGEVMACLVRVPTENVKQKLQAGIHSSTVGCVKAIIAEAGAAGFYQGCALEPTVGHTLHQRAACSSLLPRRQTGRRTGSAADSCCPWRVSAPARPAVSFRCRRHRRRCCWSRADLTTVMREIPFSAIQFPLYEGAKKTWGAWQGHPVNTVQAMMCGSVCGGFAAACTTPLDVTKTRLMLGADAKGVPYKVRSACNSAAVSVSSCRPI
jgi:hypothetical protein